MDIVENVKQLFNCKVGTYCQHCGRENKLFSYGKFNINTGKQNTQFGCEKCYLNNCYAGW